MGRLRREICCSRYPASPGHSIAFQKIAPPFYFNLDAGGWKVGDRAILQHVEPTVARASGGVERLACSLAMLLSGLGL